MRLFCVYSKIGYNNELQLRVGAGQRPELTSLLESLRCSRRPGGSPFPCPLWVSRTVISAKAVLLPFPPCNDNVFRCVLRESCTQDWLYFDCAGVVVINIALMDAVDT